MIPITCYIIDDEFHAVEILREYIRTTPGLQLAGFNVDPLAALAEVQLSRPDLIFLDVEMPELSGLEIADLVSLTSLVVFTTSFSQYALAAYDKQVFDYLLKPVTYERFTRCIFKARKDLQRIAPADKGDPGFFYIKTDPRNRLVKIETKTIRYVEAAANYVKIQLNDEKQLAYLTISELSDYLPAAEFSRIHKSFLVHHSAIKGLEPGQVRLDNGVCLPIGRVYKEAFFKKMNQLVLKSYRDA